MLHLRYLFIGTLCTLAIVFVIVKALHPGQQTSDPDPLNYPSAPINKGTLSALPVISPADQHAAIPLLSDKRILNADATVQPTPGVTIVSAALDPHEIAQPTPVGTSIYSTGLPADKNDPALLAERQAAFDRLYTMVRDQSRGVPLDQRAALDVVDQLIRLHHQGYIPAQDVINALNYLKKAVPDLDVHIASRIKQIQPSSH